MIGVLRPTVSGLLGCLALLSACGPITYVHRVTFNGTGEVAQARVANAEKMAPYEYTAASAYLLRAQELAGYARFQDANDFAQKARGHAKKAVDVARTRERRDELPQFIPDGSMYITKEGTVKRGRPNDPVQDVDDEKPPLGDVDTEKPPLGDAPGLKGGKARPAKAEDVVADPATPVKPGKSGKKGGSR